MYNADAIKVYSYSHCDECGCFSKDTSDIFVGLSDAGVFNPLNPEAHLNNI
jgi:hypothetical protein